MWHCWPATFSIYCLCADLDQIAAVSPRIWQNTTKAAIFHKFSVMWALTDHIGKLQKLIQSYRGSLNSSVACCSGTYTHKPGRLKVSNISNPADAFQKKINWKFIENLLKIRCLGKAIENVVRILSFKIYLEGSKLSLSTSIIFNKKYFPTWFCIEFIHLILIHFSRVWLVLLI